MAADGLSGVRKKKYAYLLVRLEDDELYSVAKVASLAVSPSEDPEAYQRVRQSLSSYARRCLLPDEGEDTMFWNGRWSAAWFGRTWKTTLSDAEHLRAQKDAEEIGQGLPPVADQAGQPRKGNRLKYGELIGMVQPFQKYAACNIVLKAEKGGYFEGEDDLSYAKYKARNAVQQFGLRHLPKAGDGIVYTETGKPVNGWYGYRWLLSLPEYVLGPDERNNLKKMVDAWKREGMVSQAGSPRPGEAIVLNDSPDVPTEKPRFQGTPSWRAVFEFTLMTSLVTIVFFAWSWHTNQMDLERKKLFLEWQPPLNLPADSINTVENVASALELVYGISVKVPNQLKDKELVEGTGGTWYDMLHQNGLDWGITESGDIQIFE